VQRKSCLWFLPLANFERFYLRLALIGILMEEWHTDNIDGGHEANYGARSRARERAYSNIDYRL
jgi:hypothetical protein